MKEKLEEMSAWFNRMDEESVGTESDFKDILGETTNTDHTYHPKI
jgi:hypothetical protein